MALKSVHRHVAEYMCGELAEVRTELLEATTAESKCEAVEHFRKMLDRFVALLSDAEEPKLVPKTSPRSKIGLGSDITQPAARFQSDGRR